MSRIFIFESGTTGWGGSFKSCFYIATSLKKQGYSVMVGYLNESEYWKELAKLDIPVRKFYHKLYSNEIKNYFTNRLLRKIDKQAKNGCYPFLSCLIQFASKVIADVGEPSKSEGDLVHMHTNFIFEI